MRCGCRPASSAISTPTVRRCRRLSRRASRRPARCRRRKPAISLIALQAQQLADLTATVAAQGRAQSLEAAQRTSAQDQGREQLRRFLTPGARLSTYSRSDVPLMRSLSQHPDELLRIAAVVLRHAVDRSGGRHPEPPRRGRGRILAPMERGTADALVDRTCALSNDHAGRYRRARYRAAASGQRIASTSSCRPNRRQPLIR